MEAKQKKTTVVVSVLALVALVLCSLSGYAGKLEPSAPPGPTMKTLDEVEPRMPISQSDIPLTISTSGSYYFTGDLTATNTGITVEANDVTIDLMGYQLIGPGSGTNYGVYMNKRSNVEVRNGTIRGFGSRGVYEADNNGKGHQVISIRAMSTGSWAGIQLKGHGHLVKNCTAAKNTTYGIHVDKACTVVGNRAFGNSTGIYTGDGCTITNNTMYDNSSEGILSNSGGTVVGNTAYNNKDGISAVFYSTVANNTAYCNQRLGIFARTGCIITGNAVGNNNTSDTALYCGGIYVMGSCQVRGNTVTFNKRNNIYIEESDNAIEENLVTNSTGNGIYFESGGNFYANNRASGNASNYANTAGNTNGGGNVEF